MKLLLPDAGYSLVEIIAKYLYLLHINFVMSFHLAIPKSRSELKLEFHHCLLSLNSDFLAMTIKGSQVNLWQQNIKWLTCTPSIWAIE